MEESKGTKWRRSIGFFLLGMGLIFYIVWSATYDAWLDIGVYSVTILFLLSGILLLLLEKKVP
jgi:cell division protein FtsW (lipid II flippase)